MHEVFDSGDDSIFASEPAQYGDEKRGKSFPLTNVFNSALIYSQYCTVDLIIMTALNNLP